MGDIRISSTYNLNLSSKGSRPKINIGLITSRLVLDDLGDKVTENQILIKRTINSYTKLLFKVMKNDEVLVSVILDACDKKEASGGLYWSLEYNDVLHEISAAGAGFHKGKWLYLENSQIIAHSVEAASSTNPWDASWTIDNKYLEGTDVVCSKTPALVWGVVPLTDIIGDIGPGSGIGGSIEWQTV